MPWRCPRRQPSSWANTTSAPSAPPSARPNRRSAASRVSRSRGAATGSSSRRSPTLSCITWCATSRGSSSRSARATSPRGGRVPFSRGAIARAAPPPPPPRDSTSGRYGIRRPSDCRYRPRTGALRPISYDRCMSWFEKIMPSRIKTERRTRSVPEGLWIKCPACDAVLYRAELERNLYVCPKCSHHMRIRGRERLERFLDPGTTQEIGAEVTSEDPLKFRDSKRYKDRLVAAQKATGETDALIVLAGTLLELPVVACAFEFQFLGGSMGSVVGERFKRAVDHCIEHREPFVCFTASGGARMQEALYSLMQMAKTAVSLSRLAQAHLPYVSVMTDPTTGGVSASLAMLGDLNIAEPRALIGFAGARVIQQTVRETLPEGFQRSEFLLEHGALDMIVDRRDMRDRIGSMLRLLMKQQPASAAAVTADAA